MAQLYFAKDGESMQSAAKTEIISVNKSVSRWQKLKKGVGTINMADINIKVKIHGDICDKLRDTYIRKNKDYGDSFAKVRAKFPSAVLIRLNDKLLRVESLYATSERLVEDESIDDTLLDLANYCIMELIERGVDVEERKNESAAHAPVQTAGPVYTCGDCRYIYKINASEETEYYLCSSKRSHNGIVTPDTPACSVCEPCGKIQ